MNRPRSVLVLTQWFPPCDRWPTAGRRIAGVARNLPQFGWAPIVVAPEPGNWCGCRGCLEGSGPENVTVKRVATTLKRSASLGRRARTGPAFAAEGPDPDRGSASRRLAYPLEVAASLVEVRTDWVARAVDAAREVILGSRPDAILASCPSFPTISAAARLSREFDIPWVADLRDPFSAALRRERLARTAMVLGRLPLRRDLRAADRIVTVSEGIAQREQRALRRPVRSVPSGWDPVDWTGVPAMPLSGTTPWLVLTGALLPGALDPGMLVEGLRRAIVTDGRRPTLHYFGRDGDLLRYAAARADFTGPIVDHGFVAAADLRSHLLAADAIVLLTNLRGMTGIPSGRLYEAIAAQRPVLVVGPADPAVHEPLRSTGQGLFASTADQVAEQLAQLGTHARPVDPEPALAFSITKTAAIIAQVLDDLHAGAQPAGVASQ